MTRNTPDDDIAQLEHLLGRSRRPRGPVSMGHVVNNLLTKRGYAAAGAAEELASAWRTAVGPRLARHTRAVAVKRGVLEIVAKSSVVVQELGFEKRSLLKRVSESFTTRRVTDLRFRVGAIE